ncbi:MAG: sodium-dependent phosphate transporter [Clostridiales bacterium GWB2_37_7]|nr:MAG: sodium-dependent phosphate transporter [Clostridiales bacterium GWB2_37_7]
MIVGLLAGLAIFLYGMKIMSDALQRSAGGRMKRLLEILTTNRFLAVMVGAAITAIIQSSSATTVMVVGLVNAGIMNLTQSIGVIMGANIGTTMTAQLIAFKFNDIIPYTLIIGAALMLFTSKKSYKLLGEFFIGFGLLFSGMHEMSAAMKPLKDLQGFTDLMVNLQQNPMLGVLVGLGLTAIIQSSSATIGILQALAFQGLIPIEAALPILFGENIGTCVTALLASIGTTVTAKRAAVMHLTFNLVGTIIFLILLKPIITLVGMTATDVARQIANAHTFFNIANVIIQFPFALMIIKFVTKVVPGEDKHDEFELQYLDSRLLETPTVAVVQIVKEIIRMGEIARSNVKDGVDAIITFNDMLIDKIYSNEKIINELEKKIGEYLVSVANTAISEDQRYKVSALFNTIHDIERIGDHAENLAEIAQYKMDNKIVFSDFAIDELKLITEKVDSALSNALEALKTEKPGLVELVDDYENTVDDLREQFKASHIKRLNEGDCNISAGVLFLDLITNLERVSDHSVNIADIVRPGVTKMTGLVV